MANSYNLDNPGFRRIGMTRKGYPYAESLHDKASKIRNKAQETSPDIDIFAPPQDSSDDTSHEAEEEDKSSNEHVGRRSARCKSSGQDTGKKQRELRAASSSLPISHCSSFEGAKAINGSQSSENIGKHGIDEDEEEPFGMSQPSQPLKKRKGTYSGSSQQRAVHNIHHNPPKGRNGQVRKKASSVTKKQRNGSFRTLDGCDDMIARSENLGKAEAAQFKIPPSTGNSSRAIRAQSRSSQKDQVSSQETSKPSFRAPKQITPRKKQAQPTYKPSLGSLPGPDLSQRTTRSDAISRKPPVFINPNEAPQGPNGTIEKPPDAVEQAKTQFTLSNEVRDAANLAQEKLGLSTKAPRPPSSSKAESSLQSISFDDASSDSSLSSPPSEESEGMEALKVLDPPELSMTQINIDFVNNASLGFEKVSTSRCPLCREEIDQDFLDEHAGIERLTIRQQAKFCKSHKRHAAQNAWEKQHFPQISWECLDRRLKDYHGVLDEILQGRKPSFYRNAFEDLVKSRKEKALGKALMSGNEVEELTPGYYGSRGARIMVENIMARFAPKLRRLAASDKLISSGGVSGYVQAVLVPELAVMLVSDDMKVDEDEARQILRDSINIGNLLNEEEDEMIKDPVEDPRPLSESTLL
ncbi:hypothetical protein ACLMJK_006710 [Lecanora helva]